MRGLTVGIAGSVGDQQAGHSEAGAGNTHSDTPVSPTSNKSDISTKKVDSSLPAQQSQLPRAVLVHDDAHGQRDGRQQEGSNGEGQVQPLVLVFADGPAVHLQVFFGFRRCGHVRAVFWKRKKKDVSVVVKAKLYFLNHNVAHAPSALQRRRTTAVGPCYVILLQNVESAPLSTHTRLFHSIYYYLSIDLHFFCIFSSPQNY